ncbi:MAG: type II toxin-antitoxin system RelE/ParE family toxin [Methylocystis sp.]
MAVDNADAADKVLRRFMKKARLATENPHMGAARPELSSTARILIEGHYLSIYEPPPNSVRLIAIVHAMRDSAGRLCRSPHLCTIIRIKRLGHLA